MPLPCCVLQEAAEVLAHNPVGGDMTAPVVLTGVGGQAVSLTVEIVKKLSSDEMTQIYQACAAAQSRGCGWLAMYNLHHCVSSQCG